MPNWAGGASGAGSGASIGTMIMPGLGTAIGAGVGGLLGLFTGGKKKKDAAKAGPVDPNSPEGMLQSRSKQLQGRADVQQEEGMGALNTSLNYYQDILGNDPGAALDATKAERGKVVDQYDTARQSIAEFGPKGGGTTSALANSRIQQANATSDIGANLKSQAAAGAADIGATIAGLGMTQEQLASADLDTVLNALLTREGFDVQKSGQKSSMWAGLAEAGGSILGGYLSSRKTA